MHAAAHLWAAVQIVVVADIVMSLDNVIAVAAAANGSVPLLDPRACHQRSPDRRGRCADHGAARHAADSGVGRRGAARLDRRRCHRDRSGSPSEAGCAACTVRSAPGSTPCWPRLAWRRISPITAMAANSRVAVLGVVVVLVAGAIWRKRSLQNAESNRPRRPRFSGLGAADGKVGAVVAADQIAYRLTGDFIPFDASAGTFEISILPSPDRERLFAQPDRPSPATRANAPFR